MKTKIDFKLLDYSDIEFGAEKPTQSEQKLFSDFLSSRKKTKLSQSKPYVRI
jgi:hypothetical protein